MGAETGKRHLVPRAATFPGLFPAPPPPRCLLLQGPPPGWVPASLASELALPSRGLESVLVVLVFLDSELGPVRSLLGLSGR